MRWEDEPYVKLYVRDTPEFLAMSWQARLLLHELIRKVDRAGILKVGKLGAEGIAIAIRAPLADIEGAVAELIENGRLVWNGPAGYYLIPNHIEAQTTPQSDGSRKRREREYARALGAAALAQEADAVRGEGLTAGTSGDDRSRADPRPAEPAAALSGLSRPASLDIAQSTAGAGTAAEPPKGVTESSVTQREGRPVTRGHEKSPLEEKRREERDERDGARALPRAGGRATVAPIDQNAPLPAEGRAYAETISLARIDEVYRDFVNYNVSEGKVAADWDAAWRRWCHREVRIQQRERQRNRPLERRAPMQQDAPGLVRGWKMPEVMYPPKKGAS